jgi:polysaccharide export outer membrane protein
MLFNWNPENLRCLKISPYAFAFGLLFIVFGTSCRTTQYANYFSTLTKDTILSGNLKKDFESKIQKGDILSISVSSLNGELDNRFNSAASGIPSSNFGISSSQTNGYLVDENGKVKLHFIGDIQAAGLTRRALRSMIEVALEPYLKEPIISVQYLNHKVTVIGAVNKPQVVSLSQDQISLLDALVLSGDINENSMVKKVMIIRDSADQKLVKNISLEDHSVFNSDYYYLQPDDIVYVKSDKSKLTRDEKRTNLQTGVSLVASLLSLTAIILNVLIK